MPARRGLLFFGVAATAILLVAVGLGVGLGVGLHDNHHELAEDTGANAQTTTGQVANAAAPTPGTTAATAVTPLPLWDWTNTSQKVNGMSIGNWLLLERWMDEDWFVSTSNETANDEWTWTLAAGANALSAATAHWDSWLTSDDVANIAKAGFNTIRIPTGFWAFIPTEGDEPYLTTGQISQLDRVVQAAYENNLYVMISLHGMPGNQDGTQTAGHNTSDINFYQPDQQVRADATLAAALSYMENSPYRSVFSGIGICNEPITYTDDQLQTLTDFYERSYTTISQMASPVPMIFNTAYKGIDYWRSFVSGKNSSILVIEDHPYPGNFPLQYDADSILQQVCTKSAAYANYPIPVCITEWSLTTGVTSASFENTFYQAQLSSYLQDTAGAVFWAWKTVRATNPVYSNDSTIDTYSYTTLALSNDVPAPPSNGQSALRYAQSLNSPCS